MTAVAGVAVPALTAGERLDRIPICRFHWRVLGLIAAGLFVDVYDQAMGGGIIAALSKKAGPIFGLTACFCPRRF